MILPAAHTVSISEREIHSTLVLFEVFIVNSKVSFKRLKTQQHLPPVFSLYYRTHWLACFSQTSTWYRSAQELANRWAAESELQRAAWRFSVGISALAVYGEPWLSGLGWPFFYRKNWLTGKLWIPPPPPLKVSLFSKHAEMLVVF